MEEAAAICNEILSKPFDFTIDEEVILDGDKLNYAANRCRMKRQLEKEIEIHDA